ncbi:MAG: hypothetical protein RMI51_02955 [Aquificaceae bacterium]|nr:hypothetical protein [Aquificaceae bacterium]
MREKGFALLPALVISTAVLIMGMGAMYMSEMGFRSVSAEHRWLLLEKSANAGLMQTVGDIANNSFTCGNSRNLSYNGANVEVRTTSAGGSCFVWSRATSGNASVVKVSIVTMGGSSTNHGAAVFRSLNNLSLGGSASIVSCDTNCRTSAVVIGNSLSSPPEENLVSSCPNNPRGVTALVDPYVPNAFPENADLTNKVFNNINDRNQLLQTLTNRFNVTFNNGTPNGISGNAQNITDSNGGLLPNIPSGTTIDVCRAYYNNCTARGYSISCTGNTNLNFNWAPDVYYVTVSGSNSVLFYCRNIDFGPNSTLRLDGSPMIAVTVGGVLAARDIILGNGNNNHISANLVLTLVARNSVEDNGNNLTLNNVNIFSRNITLDNAGLRLFGGVLYAGGSDAGKVDIKLNSNSQLGIVNHPVLIISDHKMEIDGRGNAEINGLVFAANTKGGFGISGDGNFSINGMVFSETYDNSVYMSGNSAIRFNPNILRTLHNRYSFVRQPECSTTQSRIPLMQTKITVY